MELKVYSVSIDITAAAVDVPLLNAEIEASGHITGFVGADLDADEDTLRINGGVLSNESGLDAVILAHSGVADDSLKDKGTIQIALTDYLSSGGGAIQFFIVAKIIELDVNGGGTKTLSYEKTAPGNYKDGMELNLETWKSSNLDGHTVTAYINGVVDSTINDVDVEASSSGPWSANKLIFGSVILPGDNIMIEFKSTLAGAPQDSGMRKLHLNYNSK